MEKLTLPPWGNIAIINRGEAALRFIRAVKEFNILHKTELKTVAFYLPQEEEAPFVQQADLAFDFIRVKDKVKIDRNVYLNHELWGEVMAIMNCMAAWAGWGFLSEEASFIRFLETRGVIFLGPSSQSVALLGDKIAAKQLAEQNQVPVTPWSKGPVVSPEEARAFADAIGYPCMIKAALTGGGRGIRRVNSAAELTSKYQSAWDETMRITGSAQLFIEQVVERGRHLEVQTLADRYGNVRTYGVRDCSVQRRNQKIIEETPPVNLEPAVLTEMEACSIRLLKAACYESAGTVEYLYDLNTSQFYFMEVNTRLQVEHPITEESCGVDLVHGQLEVAMGKEFSTGCIPCRQAVVEVRLNAEDPDRGFTPAPGKVVHFQIPAGPGLRIDSGINQGTTIPADFDSMIAKIISFAPTRELAFARLSRALTELQIKIEGGTTNRAFLKALLNCPEIKQGGVHTGFVEELLDRKQAVIEKKDWNIAVIAAAIEQYLKQYQEKLINFKQQLTGSGYPRELTVSKGIAMQLRIAGQTLQFLVKATGPDQYLVQSGNLVMAAKYNLKKHGALLIIGNYYHTIQTVQRGSDLQIEVDGVPYLVEMESGGSIKAPSPAIVVSLAVGRGHHVEKGQLLVVLEAMKMEMIVQATEAGTVREILVRAGEQVAAGQQLLILDTGSNHAASNEKQSTPADEIQLDSLINADNSWEIIKQEFLSVFLGYDHDPAVNKLLDKALSWAESQNQYTGPVSLFLTALKAYIDIERLFFSPPVRTVELSRLTSYRELLSHYFRRQVNRGKGLPEAFLKNLETALSWYLPGEGSRDELKDKAVHHLYLSHSNLTNKQELLQHTLFALKKLPLPEDCLQELSNQLDELAYLSQLDRPSLSDTAIHTRYQLIDSRIIQAWKEEKRLNISKILERLVQYERNSRIYHKLTEFIMENKYQLLYDLAQKAKEGSANKRDLVLEILSRHMCNDRKYITGYALNIENFHLYYCQTTKNDKTYPCFLTIIESADLEYFLESWIRYSKEQNTKQTDKPELIILVNQVPNMPVASLLQIMATHPLPVLWVSLGLLHPEGRSEFHSYQETDEHVWEEDTRKTGFNPRAFREFRIYRYTNFDQKIVYSSEFVHLLLLKSRENPRDERLYAMVEVPSANIQSDAAGRILRMVALENVFMEAVYAMRAEQAKRQRRLQWNRIIIQIDTLFNIALEENTEYTTRIIARAINLGIEQINIHSRKISSDGSSIEEVEACFEHTSGSGFTLLLRPPQEEKLQPVDNYAAKVVRARYQDNPYAYEILKLITSATRQLKAPFPEGEFEEYDLESNPTSSGNQLCHSVKGRKPGDNASNVIFGIITNRTEILATGFQRVILLSDTTLNMGALAEAECRRIIAALDLAEEKQIPLEWLPISSGARIDMDSGTENLDWTARVLRHIIRFTQAGGEINIIVPGINIGAQSYWNAEATMLMHTRGLLIMTETASMLLTGKKALDFSGSVSAENNVAIGGVEQIMGPNGQAQIRVKNIDEAYQILFRHYALTYREPGRTRPVVVKTKDPPDRDICQTPYQDPLNQGFKAIGDIFSASLNPERKKPFDMRQVMHAVIDQDSPVFERWTEMKDAEIAIIWEARIGGFAAGLIGIESRPLARIGEIPHDGPEIWTGGTLFPLSSKKLARGINAFNGIMPLVILANLSGFDGSPESLRKLQLEYGAEIGRAIVNFKGEILFIVTARYHGGAYVVFSKTLNPSLRAAAIEGSFASVIGGAPAAAVVFPRQVQKETYEDPRIEAARQQFSLNEPEDRKRFDDLYQQVQTEKQTELARRFDSVHSVERAKQVGSIDDIITPAQLRPYLVQQLAATYLSEKTGKSGSEKMEISYG